MNYFSVQKAYVIIFIILCQFVGNKLLAQRSIYGVVQDSLGIPLKSVNVRLISSADTLKVATNANGEYRFEKINGNYIFLTYSMLGYNSATSSHFLSKVQNAFEIPKVNLKESNQIIPSVHVINVIPIIINGDTTQFNFAAYDFRKNALLEEALKNLPGFQVYRDGSVTFNGTQVKRVRVDNKDFFGGDLLTATRNLPADFIKNIQLINASTIRDDNSGISRGDDEKILNITLKEDRKKIYFGQLTGGGGTNDRYVGSFGLNKFDEGTELSLLGSFNNTNTNLFTFGNPAGGDRIKSTMEMGDYADPIDGLNKVGSIGLNVADQLSKRIYFNASYNYIYQNNLTDGISQLTSTYVGNTIYKKDNYSINTSDKNHKLRFGFDIKLSNNDMVKIDGNFSLNQQFSEQVKQSSLKNNINRSDGNYQDSSRKSSPNGDLDILYSKNFKKKGRKLIGNLILNSNNQNRSEYITEHYLEYILGKEKDFDTEFYQNQYISQRNHTNDTKLIVSYVEPFSAHSLFEFAYEFDITSIEALRLVEDRTSMSDYKFIDNLTVDYNYLFKSHRGSMTYQYEPNKKFKMNVGFSVQPIVMTGQLPRETIIYNYDNVNLIPTANIIYKFSKEMDWQLNYKGKNNQPYFNQIAPVIDNTNSRSILIGNPELKAEYTHRISSTFRKSISSRMQYFETNIAYNFVSNKIVSDKRTLTNSTIQETTFKNSSGYYDWRWYYTFNTPLFVEDLQLDLTGTTDYYNNLSFIESRKRTTKQLLVNQSMQLKYNWNDYFESVLNAQYLWNQARYDLPYRTKINIETMFLGLGAKGYINDSWALGLEMSQRYNDGYKNNLLNVNQTVMNSFIEFTFLRNRSALIRLQGNDLFDQNKNAGIITEYIGNDVYEARNNRLGRYFMLSLNLRLQKLPKKK